MKKFIIIIILLVFLSIGIVWAMHCPDKGRANQPTFSVIAYNVGDIQRKTFPEKETADVISAAGKPDIMLLEEMPIGPVGQRFEQMLGYPYVARGPQHEGKVTALGVMSVYPIEESQIIPLPSNGKGAGALCATLDMGGWNLTACAVHLDEVTPKDRDEGGKVKFTGKEIASILLSEFFKDSIRADATKELMTQVKDRKWNSVILGGDFNTFPGSLAIRNVNRNFEDAFWPSFEYLTGTYFKIDFPLRPRIDYIFHSDALSVLRAEVVKHSAGDHFPVKALFKKTHDVS